MGEVYRARDQKLGRDVAIKVLPADVAGNTERLARFKREAQVLASLAGMSVVVPKPEHLAAMKIHAMKNDPSRAFQEMADIQFLMRLPGVDRGQIREYFERSGQVERFHELERSI
jgi:serine/threonine protein kinase